DSLSETVQETVRLYQQGFAPSRIAAARTMAESTIYGHLLRWYESGGDLKLEDLITREEERQILHAMADAEDYTKLKPIKDKLPEEISYEKIRMVVAKVRKISV
ncbi:MAG: helix-turn-helix domain-containing protein, partial [Patescibacteria group bacterium]